MTFYVLGFAFDDDGKVLLIRRSKDPYKGLLNGLGGKVNTPRETHVDAMCREFEEECGLKISPDNLEEFCTFNAGEDSVTVFRINTDLRSFRGRWLETSEGEISLFFPGNAAAAAFHLDWLLPMALSDDVLSAHVNMKAYEA